jgi:hypothetical protein
LVGLMLNHKVAALLHSIKIINTAKSYDFYVP